MDATFKDDGGQAPRRWTLKRFAPSIGSGRETRVLGYVLKDGEEIRVREDAFTDEDVEKVAIVLALELNGTLDEMWDGLGEALKDHRRGQARKLLSRVFGATDEREVEDIERIWTCKIGGEVDGLPEGADSSLRRAVIDAYVKLTGREPEFTFSGWGGSLTDSEREAANT